jgi:hypothetical protein
VQEQLTLVSAGSWLGIWVAAIGVVGLLIRQISPWRKQASDAEARLRDSLIERVGRLETRLDRQQVRHDAEKRLLTHKLRNMTANFDSMLMMLEMNPDRGPEIVTAIKEQRAKQMVAESQEAATIYAVDLKGLALDETSSDGSNQGLTSPDVVID